MAKCKVVKIKKEQPGSWQDALEEFLWWKQAQGLAKTTIEDYRNYITRFFKNYPYAYDPAELKKAVLDYMAKPAKPAYFNLKLIYLRVLVSWGVKEGLYFENPLAGMKKKKAEGKAVQIGEETLKELLSLPDKGTYAGLRDYCMILLTLDTGIRPSEALALGLADINLKGLEVRVDAESAKTRISRTLPITKTSSKVIKELISTRHPNWGKQAPLFCTVDGQPMKRASWWERMRIYSNKFRHSNYHLPVETRFRASADDGAHRSYNDKKICCLDPGGHPEPT